MVVLSDDGSIVGASDHDVVPVNTRATTRVAPTLGHVIGTYKSLVTTQPINYSTIQLAFSLPFNHLTIQLFNLFCAFSHLTNQLFPYSTGFGSRLPTDFMSLITVLQHLDAGSSPA